jgi:hypothetical protein
MELQNAWIADACVIVSVAAFGVAAWMSKSLVLLGVAFLIAGVFLFGGGVS